MSLKVFYPKNLFKNLRFCFNIDIKINNACYLYIKLNKKRKGEETTIMNFCAFKNCNQLNY